MNLQKKKEHLQSRKCSKIHLQHFLHWHDPTGSKGQRPHSPYSQLRGSPPGSSLVVCSAGSFSRLGLDYKPLRRQMQGLEAIFCKIRRALRTRPFIPCSKTIPPRPDRREQKTGFLLYPKPRCAPYPPPRA